MGGFVFDTQELPRERKFLPRNRDRVTLAPDAIIFLAEHAPWLFPDISEAEIQDKSKGNSLAKGIVCVQATWFIIQCIFRLRDGLAISLLELNVCAHALCVFFIYAMWWNKPLDCEEPTPIKGPHSHECCAWMCFYSEFDGYKDSASLEFILDSTERPSTTVSFPWDTKHVKQRRTEPSDISTEIANIFHAGSRVDDVVYRRDKDPKWHSETKTLSGNITIDHPRLPYHNYDKRRWTLAARGAQQHHTWKVSSEQTLSQAIVAFESTTQWPKNENPIRSRMRNWPIDFEFTSTLDSSSLGELMSGSSLIMSLAFTFAGLFYGSVHLLAWTYSFPSSLESLLWRISAVTVAASGPVILIGNIITIILSDSDLNCLFISVLGTLISGLYYLRKLSFWDLPGLLWHLPSLLWALLWEFPDLLRVFWTLFTVFIFPIFYLFVRAFLVIECFISFPYLADSAYVQPQWSYIFPHIS